MALFIGMTYPDTNLNETPFGRAIVEIASELQKLRVGDLAPNLAKIDLQFLLPGKFEKPPFKGMRMRSYSKDIQCLNFESSVPESMVHSQYAKAYILAAIQDAIENANYFYIDQRMLCDFNKELKLVNEMEKNLNVRAAS